MEIKYCPICKTELIGVGILEYVCPHCKEGLYISIACKVEHPEEPGVRNE